MVIKLNYRVIKIVVLSVFLIITLSISLYSSSVVTDTELAKIEKLRLPIVMYHQVKKNNLGRDIISPAEFEEDLKYLKENNYTKEFSKFGNN